MPLLYPEEVHLKDICLQAQTIRQCYCLNTISLSNQGGIRNARDNDEKNEIIVEVKVLWRRKKNKSGGSNAEMIIVERMKVLFL
jgi:hypothetical protein